MNARPLSHLNWRIALLLAVVVTLICFPLFSRLSVMRALDLRLLDWRLRADSPSAPPDQVVIVSLQSSTFDSLPTWGPTALSRSCYAPVIDHLTAAGARVLAMDIYFGEAQSDPEADAQLARAMEESGRVIVVADAVPQLGPGGRETVDFTLPQDSIARAAHAVASPLLFRPDNVVRWVRLQQTDRSGKLSFPALSLAAFQAAQGPDAQIPRSNWPLMLLRWWGPAGTVRRLALEDVYKGDFDASLVRDRVVFIGRWDPVEDLLQTPVGPMNGVEIHAQATADMLAGRYARTLPASLSLLLTLALGMILALLTARQRVWGAWALTALFLGGWFGFGALAFAHWALVVPMTSTLAVLLTLGLMLSALRIRRALRSLARVWPSWVSTEGEELEATVLVCDLAGYTAHSEETAPGETMALLSRFFALVEETVGRHGGVLARRPGDAAIVFFRADAGRADAAARAVRAALDLREALDAVLAPRGMGFGITLTTGLISLGFVGPEPQILGDPINVAFRLQSECRRLNQPILADWATATADPDTALLMRPLGEVTVRHRAAPVQLFAPVPSRE